MGLQKITVIMFLISGICFSCGTLKKRKTIDTVSENVRVERVSSSVSNEKTKTEDKSVEVEKVSERDSNVSITERDIYFDDEGRITRISEVVKEVSNRESESDKRKEMDVTSVSELNSNVSESEDSESSRESVKKNTDIDRESSPVSKYVGGGILLLFVAVAVILWVRSRRW